METSSAEWEAAEDPGPPTPAQVPTASASTEGPRGPVHERLPTTPATSEPQDLCLRSLRSGGAIATSDVANAHSDSRQWVVRLDAGRLRSGQVCGSLVRGGGIGRLASHFRGCDRGEFVAHAASDPTGQQISTSTAAGDGSVWKFVCLS